MSDRRSCLDKPIIAEHLEAIWALPGVRRAAAGGLWLGLHPGVPESDPERSDGDFLVEDPDDYDFGPWASRLTGLQEALGKLLGREVDLIMTRAIRRKYFRQSINVTREILYAA